jgi:acyl carrier protein
MTVRDLLARRTGGMLEAAALSDHIPLGVDGIGLDSVAIVELLLECETEFDVRLPPDLFDGGPVTVGALVAAVEAARARQTNGS